MCTLIVAAVAAPAPARLTPTARKQLRRWSAAAVRSLAVLILLLPTACQSDGRISVDELRELEHQLTETTNVPVEQSRLALTDLQPYRVGAGDVLAIQMIGLADERYAATPLHLRVHQDGRIRLPAIGPLEVVGLDLGSAEETITAAYVPDVVKDLSVFVELASPEDTTVLVLGAAEAPGLIRLRQNERNPLYALASAGGFSPATSGHVRLRPIRPERDEVVYNFNDANDVRRALLEPPLESGDMLIAEAAEDSVVYLTGLLSEPGIVPLPQRRTLSVMRALAARGGVLDFLEPEEATLWRTLPNGQQVRVRLDLAAIQNGQAPDLALRAGDLLDVPHTAKTRARQWFLENIRFGPFGMTAVYDPVADYRARLLRDDAGDGIFQRTLLQSVGTGISELVVPPAPTPTP